MVPMTRKPIDSFAGPRSPYPIVDIVVMAQYMDCSHCDAGRIAFTEMPAIE